MDIAIVNAAPFALALLIPTIGSRFTKTLLAWIMGIVVAVLFAAMLPHLATLAQSGPLTVVLPWVPQIGLSLSLYLDGLSLLFTLIVTGIGAIVVVYAGYYFEELKSLVRFYRLLFVFMGGMLGLILAGNLLTLFICWEITSVSSFFLISFNKAEPAARRGALQALIITAGGGLAMLVGLILLGTAGQSMELSQLLASGDVLREHPYYAAITILILVGCFSKSAQFPLHFWLPDAMTAPTPASAYLHSATMVKAGIYLLFRLYPVLGNTDLWQTTLMGVGLITMITGAFLALRQRDLKALLAYATISQLGALVALIGLPDGAGLQAALIGLLAHALYKATLFLVAGIIDHATGTRQLDKLGGLWRKMPAVAIIATGAAITMAGLPPTLGFVAKEGLLEAALHGPASTLTLAIIVLSAAFNVTLAIILIWDVFVRPPQDQSAGHGHHLHLPAAGMVAGPAILAALVVIAGLGLNIFVVPLLTPALGEVELHLFAGFNQPFLLSLLAIGGGVVLYLARQPLMAVINVPVPSGRQLYDGAVGLVEASANLVLRSQNGKIRYYLISIFICTILLMATGGLSHIGNMQISIQFTSSADVLKAVLLTLSLGATLASILLKRHLLAALALGVAGYSVGGIFLLEPAPDVALVQFLVETLGTVLVITMLGRISLPERKQVIDKLWDQSRKGVIRDAVISIVIGVGVGVFTLAAVVNRPSRNTITQWHIDHAYDLLGADDIVAGIVTDFRGMDTVFEITVFGMAALGVLTLLSTPEPGKTWQFSAGRMLRLLRSRGMITDVETVAEREAKDPAIQREMAALQAQTVSHFATPLTRLVATIVLPFALLVALSHLLYGGGAPGDGFTAGVVSGLAIALWYVVFGYDEAKRRLTWLHPAQLIGVGVGLAVLNAALPLLFGKPFLFTTVLSDLHLPAGLHFSSTLVFETGIFLSVLGGSSVILETIAHPQEVETL
jgi:NADH:ubiquinone oxidoreductase subunit 5 (subunit L)/multisubunit Na+/H+ antiporter MnhA subunit